MLTVISFLFLISVLALIHEFGHFMVAKLIGVKVEEFGIGYPPRIFSVIKKGTIFSLNLIPLGGFVRLYGEEEVSGSLESAEKAFISQSALKKFFVLIAGIVLNLITGITLLFLVFSLEGVPQTDWSIRIQEVLADSPASQAGLTGGEFIVSYATEDGDWQDSFENEEFSVFIKENYGQEIRLLVSSDSSLDEGLEELNLSLAKEGDLENDVGLGIVFNLQPFVYYQKESWQVISKEIFSQTWLMFKSMLEGLSNLFIRFFSVQKAPEEVVGPVGIAQLTGQAVRRGWISFAYFAGIVSISLACFNLLPLPALDGGRIFLVLWEVVFRKPVNIRYQQWINAGGFLFLMLLMFWITFWDIRRLF